MAITVRSVPRMLEPRRTTALTLQQLRVLSRVVTMQDGAPVGRLAELFGVSLASMSNLVDRLVAADVAVRVPDATDQRVRRVAATELGRTVVADMMGASPELGADVLARLTTDELSALEVGLSALARVLRED